MTETDHDFLNVQQILKLFRAKQNRLALLVNVIGPADNHLSQHFLVGRQRSLFANRDTLKNQSERIVLPDAIFAAVANGRWVGEGAADFFLERHCWALWVSPAMLSQIGLREREREFVVTRAGRDCHVGDREVMDAVHVLIADGVNVGGWRRKRADIPGGDTLRKGQVAGRVVGQGGGEIIPSRQRDKFDLDGATWGAISDDHFPGAADQLAIDQRVAEVKRERVEAARVSEETEPCGIAVPEQQRGRLSAVGGGDGDGIGGRVENPGEVEGDRRDFFKRAIDRERATAAGHSMQKTVNVIVNRDSAKACGDRSVCNAGRGDNRFRQAASFQCGAVAGRSAGGAATGQFNGERNLHAGVSDQVFGDSQIGANKLAADGVTRQRLDAQIPHLDAVDRCRNRVRSVRGFVLDCDDALAAEEWHCCLPGLGVLGIPGVRCGCRQPAPSPPSPGRAGKFRRALDLQSF